MAETPTLEDWATVGPNDAPRPAPRAKPRGYLNGGARPSPADPIIIDAKAPLNTARQFVDQHHKIAHQRVMQHQQSLFLRWTGTHYKALAAEEIRADIYAFLEHALVFSGEQKDPKQYKPTATHVSNILDALRAVCQLPVDIQQPSWLHDDPLARPANELIACKNGLLHIPTGTLSPHTPAFFAGTALSYDYDARAPIPTEWHNFIKAIWGDDQSAIDTLQDIFGYLLGTDTDQQKLFLLVGPKRSGKGTIGRIINALLGEDTVISPTLASLQTNFGIAPLIGKSVALIADARLGARADQHAIAERLLSISGEDKQTIDRKFLAAWNGKLSTRFIIMTNELPRIADASGALASRFVVLTMTRSFYGKEDRGMTNKLLAEMPGILNWALVGWRRLKSRGFFEQPASSAAALQDLEDLGSPIGAFLRDKCTIAQGQFVAIDSLFDAWVLWCKEQGRDHPGTKQSFGRDLRAAYPEIDTSQPRTENGRTRYYEGIGLNYVPENTQDNVF